MHAGPKPVFASVTLAVAAMLSLTAAPAAARAAATVTADPSTGLVDGQTIRVSAGGFAAGEELGVAQCARVSRTSAACDADIVWTVADTDGNAAISFVARTTFDAVDTATGEPVGVIDCLTVPGGCAVGAANISLTTVAMTPVSFLRPGTR